MSVYTAHLRTTGDPVLVREGFTWAGFFLGPIWLLSKRAWTASMFDLAAWIWMVALAPSDLLGPLALGLALIVGLTGRDMVRWSLQRRGYALTHVVLAPDEDAALVRLYAARTDLLDTGT